MFQIDLMEQYVHAYVIDLYLPYSKPLEYAFIKYLDDLGRTEEYLLRIARASI